MDIADLLAFSVKHGASDLHLSAGLAPMLPPLPSRAGVLGMQRTRGCGPTQFSRLALVMPAATDTNS